MRALRDPALGLALLTIGIGALPPQLVQIVNVYLVDHGAPVALVAPIILTAAVSATQVAAGWAIMRQRFAGIWFAAYILACFALTIGTATIARGQTTVGLSLAIAAVVETFGMPVLIAVVSLRYAEEVEDTRAFSDIAAALLVIAIRTLLMVPVQIAATVRMTHGATVSLGGWASLLLWPAISVALGVFAALGMRSQAAARRYVYFAAGMVLVTSVTTIVWTQFDGSSDMVRAFVLWSRALNLLWLIGPLALWAYMHSLSTDRTWSHLPIWLALSYVPSLLGRACLARQVGAQLGDTPTAWIIAIGVGFALVLLALADAGFRALLAVRAWAIAGGVTALVLFVAGLAYVFRSDADRTRADISLIAPISLLIASTTAAAVYRRR